MSLTQSTLALTAVLFLAACGGGGGATRETPPAPPAPETPAPPPDRPPESPEQDGQDTNTPPPRPVAPTTPVAPPDAPGGTNVRVSVQEESGSWSRVSETGGSGGVRGTRNASVRSKDRARASGLGSAAVGSEPWVADRLALQPGLRDIRAQGAYRRNLTGEGVRIVVRDDPVDPDAAEVRGRTSTEGAALGYWSHERYYGGCSSIFGGDGCSEVEVESAEEAHAWIADYLSKNPYPSDDDSVFVRVKGTNEYSEVPALYDGERISEYFPRDPDRSHGTMVASIAAGKNLGVAPGATVVSQAVPFEYGDGDGQASRMIALAREVWSSSFSLPVEVHEAGIRGVVVPGESSFYGGGASAQRKARIDEGFAKAIREGMAGADVVNRSYGYGGDFDDRARDTRLALETRRWQAFVRNFPETAKAIRQEHLAEENKVIFVSAAGNSYQR